jgi:uracil-DNA glycosylase
MKEKPIPTGFIRRYSKMNEMEKEMELTWRVALKEEVEKPYFKRLKDFLQREYQGYTVYPPAEKIMTAFTLTPLDKVKAVILGQDPYHAPGQAVGLAFSVPEGAPIPCSLQNIYTELDAEYAACAHKSGDLTPWARQGVLLLNSVLTVRKGEPGSHAGYGWETYTDAVLSVLNGLNRPIVYLLWGNYAREKKELITNEKQLVLEAAHPSPFSARRGFFGCGHFTKCNEFLISHGVEPIDWKIE